MESACVHLSRTKTENFIQDPGDLKGTIEIYIRIYCNTQKYKHELTVIKILPVHILSHSVESHLRELVRED